MTKGGALFVLLVLVGCGAVFMYTSEQAKDPAITVQERPQDTPYQEEGYKNRHMSISGFIAAHISELSPVQESAGGRFYVTDVTAQGGSGVAKYSDGHAQYIADFMYTVDDADGYTITKFKLRE